MTCSCANVRNYHELILNISTWGGHIRRTRTYCGFEHWYMGVGSIPSNILNMCPILFDVSIFDHSIPPAFGPFIWIVLLANFMIFFVKNFCNQITCGDGERSYLASSERFVNVVWVSKLLLCTSLIFAGASKQRRSVKTLLKQLKILWLNHLYLKRIFS